jgi:uncharacterized protein involved in type VI secretion and phage assembly
MSVHLGYKDDTQEVFSGEITGASISLPETGPSRYRVTASSCLQSLGHGVRNRVFENKTPSQAIKDILSRYGLQEEARGCRPEGRGKERLDEDSQERRAMDA